MPPILTRQGEELALDLSGCRGSEFSDALEKIREVPGRRFDFDSKIWFAPGDPATAERIFQTIGPEAAPELMDWMRNARMQSAQELTSPLPKDASLLVPWGDKRQPWQPKVVNDEKFNGLFDYQRSAVDLIARVQRAILADDMGLGKTIQAITAVEEYKLRQQIKLGSIPEGPKLVVAPASVKGGWARELDRWLDDPPVQIIDAASAAARTKQVESIIEADGWCIVNWEQLRIQKVKRKVKTRLGGIKTSIDTVMKEPLFEKTQWIAAIADEVHRAKNRKSQQTQGLWRIKADIMLGLSGTPLMNNPAELWSILRWLYPEQYGNSTPGHPRTPYWAFHDQYCEFYETFRFGKVITGVKNPDALRFELKDRLIRRTTGNGGRKRIYYDVPMHPKQRKLYEQAEKDMWLQVEQDAANGDASAEAFVKAALIDGATPANLYRIPNGAARMVRLQQILETPALLGAEDNSGIMDDCEQKFADSRPEQWMFFVKFRGSADILAERLTRKYGARCAVYTGEVAAADRTEIEDAFQRGELDAVIGTIAAMKEGITMTSGRCQSWLSRSWVPAENEQGEAREDRIGQQREVLVYIPETPNSVATNNVAPTNRLKEKIVSTVVAKDKIKEVNQ